MMPTTDMQNSTESAMHWWYYTWFHRDGQRNAMFYVFLSTKLSSTGYFTNDYYHEKYIELECGPMPNVMAALPNIGGALC